MTPEFPRSSHFQNVQYKHHQQKNLEHVAFLGPPKDKVDVLVAFSAGRELIPSLELGRDPGLGTSPGPRRRGAARPHLDVACPNELAVAPLADVAVRGAFRQVVAKDPRPVGQREGKVRADRPVAVVHPVRVCDRHTVGRTGREPVTVAELARNPGLGASAGPARHVAVRPHLKVARPYDFALAPLFDVTVNGTVCYDVAEDLRPIGHAEGKVRPNGSSAVVLPIRHDRNTGGPWARRWTERRVCGVT